MLAISKSVTHRTWRGVGNLCLIPLQLQTKAQAGVINNWEALKCFDHCMFPQILFSSQLSQDSLPRESYSVITSSLMILGIFKHKYLNALKIMLAVSKVYRVQANQGE